MSQTENTDRQRLLMIHEIFLGAVLLVSAVGSFAAVCMGAACKHQVYAPRFKSTGPPAWSGYPHKPHIMRAEGPFEVCLLGIDRWPCKSAALPKGLVSGYTSIVVAAILHDGVLLSSSASRNFSARVRLDEGKFPPVRSHEVGQTDFTRITFDFRSILLPVATSGHVTLDSWVEQNGVFIEGSYTTRHVPVRHASWHHGPTGGERIFGATVFGGYVRSLLRSLARFPFRKSHSDFCRCGLGHLGQQLMSQPLTRLMCGLRTCSAKSSKTAASPSTWARGSSSPTIRARRSGTCSWRLRKTQRSSCLTSCRVTDTRHSVAHLLWMRIMRERDRQ